MSDAAAYTVCRGARRLFVPSLSGAHATATRSRTDPRPRRTSPDCRRAVSTDLVASHGDCDGAHLEPEVCTASLLIIDTTRNGRRRSTWPHRCRLVSVTTDEPVPIGLATREGFGARLPCGRASWASSIRRRLRPASSRWPSVTPARPSVGPFVTDTMSGSIGILLCGMPSPYSTPAL